jgi:mRNA-degrading endonuclease RelE of RelBE toxin-antitoxin system
VSYRVQYTNQAEDGLKPLSGQQIRAFKNAVDSSLGRDPYGSGSSQVGNDRDRREATISGVFVRYTVSAGVLVVAVTRAVAF